MDLDGNKNVFQRVGGGSFVDPNRNNGKQQKVCYHWRAGKCNRFPCPFLHRELPMPSNGVLTSKRPHGGFSEDGFSGSTRQKAHSFSSGSNTWGRNTNRFLVRKMERVCNFWVQGTCTYGEKCRYLHSWSIGETFSFLTQLVGHQKVVTAIAFPSGSINFTLEAKMRLL